VASAWIIFEDEQTHRRTGTKTRRQTHIRTDTQSQAYTLAHTHTHTRARARVRTPVAMQVAVDKNDVGKKKVKAGTSRRGL